MDRLREHIHPHPLEPLVGQRSKARIQHRPQCLDKWRQRVREVAVLVASTEAVTRHDDATAKATHQAQQVSVCRCRLSRQACAADHRIPHVVSRPKEVAAKRRNPEKKPRRWVVEVCHSWLNRFRKLLVRYQKLGRSFVALNHIAAGIIVFRKNKRAIDIFYG